MAHYSSWDRFMMSGKVEDYLIYAADRKNEKNRPAGYSEKETACLKGRDEYYAGLAQADRPGTESRADRRI